MARVFSDDCIAVVRNHFELILLAAHRARELSAGKEPVVKEVSHRSPVLALKEIASGALLIDNLENRLTETLRRVPDPVDEDDTLTTFDPIDEETMLGGIGAIRKEKSLARERSLK